MKFIVMQSLQRPEEHPLIFIAPDGVDAPVMPKEKWRVWDITGDTPTIITDSLEARNMALEFDEELEREEESDSSLAGRALDLLRGGSLDGAQGAERLLRQIICNGGRRAEAVVGQGDIVAIVKKALLTLDGSGIFGPTRAILHDALLSIIQRGGQTAAAGLNR